ncbi:MFS transporter [Paenibacillus enshidis]|uniref:MFS transporter n=1 Tax=Paenibacillus enshidis TaxID=1458439 RepID=A0ABV5AZS1_9BACL
MFKYVLILGFAFQIILNMSRPALSLYASFLGATPFTVGVLTACYAVLPLFLAIRAGKIADAIGDRLPVLFGMSSLGVGMLLPWLFPYLWSLFASQLLTGLASVFIAVSLQNVLGKHAPEGKRDDYYSHFSTVNSLAAVAGPMTAGYLLDLTTYSFVFAAASMVAASTFLFSLKLPGTRNRTAPSNIKLSESLGLLKSKPLRKALIGNALALYSRDIFTAYFPLYAVSHGISASVIGWILSIQGIAMVAVRFVLPRLIRISNHQLILIGSVVAAGIAFLGVAVSEHYLWMSFWSVVMGFGLGCGQPISMAVAYNSSPKSRTGEVLGLRLAANRLSQLAAPLFFGFIGASLGLLSVFYVSGVFLLGGSWLIRQEKEQADGGMG